MFYIPLIHSRNFSNVFAKFFDFVTGEYNHKEGGMSNFSKISRIHNFVPLSEIFACILPFCIRNI